MELVHVAVVSYFLAAFHPVSNYIYISNRLLLHITKKQLKPCDPVVNIYYETSSQNSEYRAEESHNRLLGLLHDGTSAPDRRPHPGTLLQVGHELGTEGGVHFR